MKPRAFFIGAAFLLAALFLAHETGNARKIGSDTSRVYIDGRSFLLLDPSSGSGPALRRELARLGVEAPEDIEILDRSHPPDPVSSNPLLASGEAFHEKPPRAPEGLRAEHALRMSGGEGTVELVLGRVDAGSGTAAANLEGARWTRVQAEGGRNLPKILRSNRGKETDIVFMDETEGTFLLFRRLGR